MERDSYDRCENCWHVQVHTLGGVRQTDGWMYQVWCTHSPKWECVSLGHFCSHFRPKKGPPNDD
jgi:hypothetical protein